MNPCPCGSELEYNTCCQPIISGEKLAKTPEEVMRSRYSAFSEIELDYLKESLHPDHRNDYDEESVRSWSVNSEWEKLEIVNSEINEDGITGNVEFIAHFSQNDQQVVHHELATFEKMDDKWYFVDGNPVVAKPVKRETPKVGRNQPCPCGSGKKYKKCCGKN